MDRVPAFEKVYSDYANAKIALSRRSLNTSIQIKKRKLGDVRAEFALFYLECRGRNPLPRCGRGVHKYHQYISPDIPPAGVVGAASLMSVTRHSVVSSVLATEAAFCKALLVTFVGSRMPALTISQYASCAAS